DPWLRHAGPPFLRRPNIPRGSAACQGHPRNSPCSRSNRATSTKKTNIRSKVSSPTQSPQVAEAGSSAGPAGAPAASAGSASGSRRRFPFVYVRRVLPVRLAHAFPPSGPDPPRLPRRLVDQHPLQIAHRLGEALLHAHVAVLVLDRQHAVVALAAQHADE